MIKTLKWNYLNLKEQERRSDTSFLCNVFNIKYQNWVYTVYIFYVHGLIINADKKIPERKTLARLLRLTSAAP